VSVKVADEEAESLERNQNWVVKGVLRIFKQREAFTVVLDTLRGKRAKLRSVKRRHAQTPSALRPVTPHGGCAGSRSATDELSGENIGASSVAARPARRKPDQGEGPSWWRRFANRSWEHLRVSVFGSKAVIRPSTAFGTQASSKMRTLLNP
jgi:hypothetical protein